MRQTTLKRCISSLLISVLLLSLFSGCGIIKRKVIERQSGTLTAANTRVGSDRLALDMGQYPLAKDAECEIISVDAPSDMEGVAIRAYSFLIDTDEELFSVMKLTMPYNAAALGGQSAEGSVCAAYFNNDSGQWEPVPFTVDEKTKTVTVYTDHLSIYGCFEVTNENTRKAYAVYAIPAFAKSSLSNTAANSVITASVQNNGNPGAGAIEAGLSALDLALSISSAGVETAAQIAGSLGSDGVARSSLLNGISERLGDLGLLCSISQVSYGMYNIYNGDNDAIFPCYANALKTGIGYTAGKMGARLFSLASLGTLVIELSLNQFAETAWTGRQDIYEKAYSLYYESPEVRKDAKAWARLFIEAKDGAASAEKYQLRVEGLVQRYADEFWEDEQEVALYQDEAQKQGFTGGGGLNDKMKADISNRYRDELFRTVIQDAFKLIAEKEAMAAERALLRELNAVREELNKTCTVEIVDTAVPDDVSTSDYAGWTAYMDVPDTIADAQEWSVKLDSEGRGKISFTVLAYLMAGAPGELKLYEDGSSAAGAPDLIVPFEAAYPTTVVELQSTEEEKTPSAQPSAPSPETTQAQSETKKYAWGLVDTISSDNKAEIDHTNKGGIYQLSSSAAPGSYTFSSKYIGETDTYPDPDQVSGEGWATKLDFSVPPTVIQGGETITLSFTLAFTEQNISYFDGTGSARADLDSTKFVNKDNKSFFEIYCSVKYNSKNVLSLSDTISAIAPNGYSEGEKIELSTTGLYAGIGTTYVYEWKAQ